jgi:hypothetical protein
MSQAAPRIDPELISVYRGPPVPILRDTREAYGNLRRAMAAVEAASMCNAEDLSDLHLVVSATAGAAISAAGALIVALEGVRDRMEPGAMEARERRLEEQDAE